MDTALLSTKLHLPPRRPALVARPRLLARLQAGLSRKLTLIVAPPGFGKTTLLSDWLRQIDRSTAWLSLDPADNDITRFLAYLIAALQQIDPAIGHTAQALLQAAQNPRPDLLLTQLINDIAARPGQMLLALDDYHLIDNPAIHKALDFFIAHMPADLHLILVSRSQPQLALSRLRGQGQLVELNSADLRFTAVEVEQFLTETMRLKLTSSARTALEMRTEGWIAGLQLAGLSLQGQDDVSAFITAFSGANRYIGDYLFEEALQRQPLDIRHFLLATSILDHLCGDLCDALLNDSGSQAMLERLDELQLFIVPLDQRRHWYRYHHLFSDLLRHHLSRTAPEQIPPLHRRASRWFEQQDQLETAIRHSVLAKDVERTADLIETAFQQKDWVGQDMRHLLEWYETLPERVIQTRPHLELGVAWLLFEIFADQWERIAKHLGRVENALTAADAKASFSEQETQEMLASVDLLRANQARQADDSARVIALCEQALERLPADETYLRSGAIAHLAAAYENLGQTTQAVQLYADSIRMGRKANNLDGLLFAAARLIQLLSVSGQLRQAERAFDQLRVYADQRSGPDMGLVSISIGEIYREQNRLEMAKTYLQQGLERCRPFDAWYAAVMTGLISLARLLMAEGHAAEAMSTLSEIEALPSPTTRLEQATLEATRARLQLEQGDFNAAARWVRGSGLPLGDKTDEDKTEDETGHQYETHYLILVRVLIAQAALETRGIDPLRISADPLNEANRLLTRLYKAADVGGRVGRVIEIHLLQALVHRRQQETSAALSCLTKALTLAETEGYIRLFVDEGQPVYQLLTLLSTQPALSISDDYIQTLLAAFPPSMAQSTQTVTQPGERLTDRELTTLHFLATERSIEEIAAEMTVAVSTVRTYAKRIYSKLDVHSRAEAVYRAKALKLLV